MKYGTWNVAPLDEEQAAALVSAGISPLAAAVLVSRGYNTPAKAARFLASGHGSLLNPMDMPDMAKAVARIRQALDSGETIAVYGDYDVDGITSTCLLTTFLIKHGANCTWYIPARLEEGYGLNTPAIRSLYEQGVRLIITVDCGITAVDEALLCRELGIDLIITDHHECKAQLPEAVAVVNPHRHDSLYPFPHLAGVGVAFKLAAAIQGDQQQVFHEYCDLVSLGTIADVMPLINENRIFVTAGISAMQHSRRPGLQALMRECQISPGTVTSSTVGYTLAPRINAAGRMGQVELAAQLFMTYDLEEAAQLAAQLCRLNRQRQAIEAEIYDETVQMLDGVSQPDAIVLAGESWHQGVVGIVASRLSEEYGCPVFLICLTGASGKASSRSYGNFPLFSALQQLEPLLLSFGGHELAAGFTILRENIPEFRRQVTAIAHEYRLHHPDGSALELDCAVSPELLTTANVAALEELEPFGAACPRPLLYLENMRAEQLTEVGGGKHLKLRLGHKGRLLDGIFFSTTACKAAIAPGDMVEVAFTPQINEFRGLRTVQLNITDIRPSLSCRIAMERERELYASLMSEAVSLLDTDSLIPPRKEFAAVWRYLTANCSQGCIMDEFTVLSRKIARSAGLPVSFVRTRICLDVFAEQGLIRLDAGPRAMTIHLTPSRSKVNLNDSVILLRLKSQKRGD